MRISTNFGLPLAALLFGVVLMPSLGWASSPRTQNCPPEPTQHVPIVSGETYYGTNCVLRLTGDQDEFQFMASAGDTWRMVTAMTNTGYPNNICLTLYGPGNPPTLIWSGCSYSLGGYLATGTNQILKVAGLYTVVVAEPQNAVLDYALSLERLSPAPPDGIPLVLSHNITGQVNPPTAQDAFTFAGLTSGTYRITASFASGGYPNNLCFDVYQPNGTSPVSGACTYSLGGYLSVQRDVTPTQNGTYVVVVYAAGQDATINYNLEVSCLGTGNCIPPPPPTTCLLMDTPTYNAASDTLTMNFTVGTPYAATWNVWLTYQNTLVPLLSQSQPITEPPKKFTVTHPGLAKSGVVGILSTLTTPPTKTPGGIRCQSWTLFNTGTP